MFHSSPSGVEEATLPRFPKTYEAEGRKEREVDPSCAGRTVNVHHCCEEMLTWLAPQWRHMGFGVKRSVSALLGVSALVLAAAPVCARFVLVSADAWVEVNAPGDPPKDTTCGVSDIAKGMPTGKLTATTGGKKLYITIREAIRNRVRLFWPTACLSIASVRNRTSTARSAPSSCCRSWRSTTSTRKAICPTATART
jgi:hypothetical protein